MVAIFANVLELDENGQPVNARYAERRAAAHLFAYCTGRWPEGEPPLADWEVALH